MTIKYLCSLTGSSRGYSSDCLVVCLSETQYDFLIETTNFAAKKYNSYPLKTPTPFTDKFTSTGVLEDELKNDTRFKLTVDDSKNNLDISNAQSSDSGTYFCTMSYSMIFQFVQSITVFVKVAQLNVKAAVSQSPHEGIEPGDSVVLKCTVEAEICDGQNRVLWFKQSEESAAGVLYSHGDSRDQCESNTDSPTKSCVYNLPIHNVSSEQTGTYYCAVAACGQVLLGNGTRVSFEAVPVHVYVLSGALVLTSSLLIGVTFCLCMKNSTGSRQNSDYSAKSNGFPKLVQYMAAEQVAEERRRLMDGSWSECIYYSVERGFK
ncbi:uncharacterized protein LOC117386413 [Periophthalmus magnuspinnatus]|uniref:uncharacterized protein LOC117386413 n=1 Tax=Periophthalmus magnuspinnatus TaxID=409849 RepID=UPI00243732E0|nr:uncharacterized protein LOC117386413 [Periophthalmus magnuspinnatus]